jgi:hypothetical protein
MRIEIKPNKTKTAKPPVLYFSKKIIENISIKINNDIKEMKEENNKENNKQKNDLNVLKEENNKLKNDI